MTVLTCASTGKSITLLGEEIANSGEAKVWRTNQNGYLAKIYHSPTPERVQKLAVMIANPPTEPNSHLHHVSFAWPKSALKNAQGDCVGFLMPEIKDGKELIDVYNPRRRQALKLEIDWRFLHTTALNIVSIIEALHAAGYVLGDIKPQNILVNNRALPSIIDTDSFQVINPKNGKVYYCLVGSPGYTPPELMGKDFASIEQTEVHDRFRLGVIIYQLLFSGNNHFQGKWTGAGENPEPDEIIRQGLWLYSANSLIEPVPITIPMIIVHPAIRECFLKCFNDGHKNPNLRPTAREWLKALRTGNDNLTICGRVDSHYYSRTFGNCYWCDRFAKLGIDIFPGNQTSYKNKDADSYNDSGVARYNLGDKQGAINYYNQALKINPNYALAYNNRGSARYDLGDKQGAIDDYNQALNIDPNYINAYYGRGNARYDLGDKQGAIDDYNQALNIDSLLFFTIGNIFSSSNNINFLKNESKKLNQSELREIAKKIANREIEKSIIGIGISFKIDEKTKIPTIANIFDNSPAALGNLKVGDQIVEVNGISTLNMSAREVHNLIRGDVNTIISLRIRRQGYIDTNTTLTRQLLPNPNLDKQYLRRCSAWLELKEYNKAIEDCNEVIKINPNNDEAYFSRGSSYYLSGRRNQGVEDFQKAASLGNENARKILKKI